MSKTQSGFSQTDPIIREVIVGQSRPWIGALCVYLAALMVGLPLNSLPESKNVEPEGLWVVAVFMTIFISPVVFAGWLCFTQKVKIQRTKAYLIVRRRRFGFRRNKRYLLQDIRNLRAYGPIVDSAYSRKFEVIFDYHGETIPMVKRLTLAKANLIIEQLFH